MLRCKGLPYIHPQNPMLRSASTDSEFPKELPTEVRRLPRPRVVDGVITEERSTILNLSPLTIPEIIAKMTRKLMMKGCTKQTLRIETPPMPHSLVLSLVTSQSSTFPQSLTTGRSSAMHLCHCQRAPQQLRKQLANLTPSFPLSSSAATLLVFSFQIAPNPASASRIG